MSQPLTLTSSRLRSLRALEASYEPSSWAKALLQHIKTRARKRGEALRHMEDYHIEGLAAFQGYRCVICGVQFVLPDDRELKNQRGYMKWFNGLPPYDRARAAVAVRADPMLPWMPGNMILATEAWAKVYELSADSVSFHQCILDVLNRIKENKFTIMTEEDYADALFNLAEAKGG
jgi:hypothetical protein